MVGGQPKEWSRIGFMQGRLVDQIDDKIQAFPVDMWEKELALAAFHGFEFLEWTVDKDSLDENPFLSGDAVHSVMNELHSRDLRVDSVTLDIFMEAPFYVDGSAYVWDRILGFLVKSSPDTQLKTIVIPLVDGSSISSEKTEDVLCNYMLSWADNFKQYGVNVAFEVDMNPERALKFINKLPEDCFGINYDTGNSASLGFDPTLEINTYGHRIINVHIKDRELYGTTVPLTEGNADFPTIFRELKAYKGNYILQTARAEDRDHSSALLKYRDMVTEWLR